MSKFNIGRIRSYFTVYRNKNFFMKILFTTLFLVIVPVSMIIIIYMSTFLNGMQKEMINSHRLTLGRMLEITEERLNNAEQGILNILLYDSSYYDDAATVPTDYSRVLLDKLKQSLVKVKIGNKIVDDIFIVDKNTNLVVSTNSVYDFDVFFGTLNKYEGYSTDLWEGYFKNNLYKDNGIIASADISRMFEGVQRNYKTVVTFIRGLNQFQSDPSKVYCITVEESEMLEFVDKLNITKDGFVYIVNEKGGVIASTDKGNKFSSFINPSLLGELSSGGSTAKTIDGHKYNIIAYSSQNFNFSYVALIPSQELLDKSKYFTGMLEVFGLIVILLACFAAFIMSGRMYKPILNLMALVGNSSKVQAEHGKNEFEYISANIVNILNKSNSLDTAYRASLAFSRESVLNNLIKGKYNFYDDNPEILKHFDLSLSRSNFVVFVIKIDSFQSFKQRYNEYDRELMKLCISNICEELSAPHGFCFPASESEMCLLLNYDNSCSINNNLLKLAHRMIQNISSNLEFSVTIGIGNVKKDIHDIAKSYNEACTALQLRSIGSTAQAMEYHQTSFSNVDYYYPVEREISIINFLKAGDYENALKIIETIIDENYSRNIAYRDLNFILSELVSAVLKTVYEIGGKIQDIFNIQSDLSEELFENDTPEDIKGWFVKVCKRLCNYINEHRESNNTTVLKKLLEYISENYNKEISLESAADYFNMSYSYLSRYFKQQTGCNFIYYLYRLRVEKSKELLTGTNLRINQVAESVGFSDVNNFIRIFKKYEGITPGKFREYS